MPGALLHVGATVQCAHTGQATLTTSNQRVLVSGHPIITLTPPCTVTGCQLSNGPCGPAQWTQGAKRVRASGEPVVLVDSESICVPTSSSLDPKIFQKRVLGV
jgi:hypothetical protein